MKLTTTDSALLGSLNVLTDIEIGRVQAHLAAGLPMRKNYGWDHQWFQPSCFGCLIGTGMTQEEFFDSARVQQLDELATHTFIFWVNDLSNVGLDEALPQIVLDRLAALLDMEWSRRHPVDTTVPTTEQITQPQLVEAR